MVNWSSATKSTTLACSRISLRGKAKLKEGTNKIVVKICQNDQKQPWAQNWMFQVRICDATGKAIEPATAENDPAEN